MAFMKLGDMAEGSIIKLNEDGAAVEFYVAKQDYESELNGLGRVLVVRKDCCDNMEWNHALDNNYVISGINAWLNGTYKNLLGADIRDAAMMGTTKFYSSSSASNAVTVLEKSVFLLSGQPCVCQPEAAYGGRWAYYRVCAVGGGAYPGGCGICGDGDQQRLG